MVLVVTRLTLLTLALALGDCTPSSPGEHDDVKNTSANDDSTQGPYDGVLPCANCGGIRTRLTLHVDRSTGKPTRYTATETYLATKDGDRTFEREGNWTVMRGSADDPDATVFQLDYDRPQTLRNFLRVGDRELWLLDRDQRVIPSLAPRALSRAPDDSISKLAPPP